MAKLTLRCVQHYLLGDRKIAPGDLITFSTPEEQKWFLNNLLWSAFIPEFVDDAADTSPAGTAQADELAALAEQLAAEQGAHAATKAQLAQALAAVAAAPATPATGFPDLAHALVATTAADLTAIPGIGATTAAKLQTWAQAQITPPPADAPATDATPAAPADPAATP